MDKPCLKHSFMPRVTLINLKNWKHFNEKKIKVTMQNTVLPVYMMIGAPLLVVAK